jgi:hypothetical protein
MGFGLDVDIIMVCVSGLLLAALWMFGKKLGLFPCDML